MFDLVVLQTGTGPLRSNGEEDPLRSAGFTRRRRGTETPPSRFFLESLCLNVEARALVGTASKETGGGQSACDAQLLLPSGSCEGETLSGKSVPFFGT